MIKLEPCSADFRATSALEHEYEVLRKLQGGIGIPRVIWMGTEGSYQAMVFESLGSSLQRLLEKMLCLSLPQVAKLGVQLVSSSLHATIF